MPELHRTGEAGHSLEGRANGKHSKTSAICDYCKITPQQLAAELENFSVVENLARHAKAKMNIVVVYVYPIHGGHHNDVARRFADTYTANLPATPHRLCIFANGGSPTPEMRETFKRVPCEFVANPDSERDGRDICAYRRAAREIKPCDLMVFFGGSSHIRGPRWLERIVESFQQHGPAIYGAMGSHVRQTHIRTTGWWCHPELLNSYPYSVSSDQESRYKFEHGDGSITNWALKRGLKALMVTWDGCYEPAQWDTIPNGFQRGDQSALIVGDRMV